MPDGFDITQRPGGGPPGGGPPGGGPPAGRPPMGRPPMGRPPMGRPPFRRPRRRPRFPVFPVFPVFPPGRCAFIDRFGRCCDRFGRCSFSDFYGGYPLTGFADTDDISYGVGWDRIDDDGTYGDLGIAVFNETDSGWDDLY